jgi:hypothetical protein
MQEGRERRRDSGEWPPPPVYESGEGGANVGLMSGVNTQRSGGSDGSVNGDRRQPEGGVEVGAPTGEEGSSNVGTIRSDGLPTYSKAVEQP